MACKCEALKAKLFDAAVVPVISYGCEVWGVTPGREINQLPLGFMHSVLKVSKTASRAIMLAELGSYR